LGTLDTPAPLLSPESADEMMAFLGSEGLRLGEICANCSRAIRPDEEADGECPNCGEMLPTNN
jgi:rubrerythrin